ncbi:MAG TPA: hypothetical protein VD833_18560 [Vicinamibacterales bacterium]|nr:hypothetical protein [Vicinamibacterales bacterium]
MSVLLAAGVLALAPVPAKAGELRLSIANGRVTLVAHDVSVRQILDEWARIGQTQIVNGDKLTGPTVTLELNDVPEGKALDTVLRSVSGYVLAARPAGAGPSVYDRIMILPTSRPPAVSAAPAAFRQPVAQPVPPPVMEPVMEDGEDRSTEGVLPPGMIPPGAMPPGMVPPAPVPPNMLQPGTMAPGATPPGGQVMPAEPDTPPTQPGAPGGQMTAPRPGMLPPPPNVPGNPYQPPPVRPPGGGN